MARTYSPVQLHSEIVDRLNDFKERVGNQVFMSPTALGLSSSIGVLLDIERFGIEHCCVPTHEDIQAIAAKYPQRGRKRVSPQPDVDRGHRLSSFGPGVRACSVCHIRFGDDEEIFAQCLGGSDGS